MKNSYGRFVRGGLLSGLPLLAATSGALGQSCWFGFAADLNGCSAGSRSSAGITPDPDADASCFSAAQMKLSACASGGNGEALLEAWNEFNARLRDCLRDYPDNEAARQACINGAFSAYRIRVRVILGLDPDPFSEQGGPESRGVQFGWPWLAASDPVETDSQFRVIGGLRHTRAERRSRNFVPLTETATMGILLVIHETAEGLASMPVDATTDLSAGIHFKASFPASRHVDADRVHLMGVYFDAQGVPVAAQMDRVMLQDSPISGDWNRDGVRDHRDMLDFVRSYNAKVSRADLNADGVVDGDDLAAFLRAF